MKAPRGGLCSGCWQLYDYNLNKILNYLVNHWSFISYSYSDVSGNAWESDILMGSISMNSICSKNMRCIFNSPSDCGSLNHAGEQHGTGVRLMAGFLCSYSSSRVRNTELTDLCCLQLHLNLSLFWRLASSACVSKRPWTKSWTPPAEATYKLVFFPNYKSVKVVF